MAEKFKSYPRKEWWREEGEVSDSARRMKENAVTKKSEVSRKKEYYDLKAGSDGKNTPSIVTKYSAKAGRKKVSERKLIAKKYVEADEFEDEDEDEFENEDSIEDMDMDMETDNIINSEDDIPVEAEDDTMSGNQAICTCPNCGAKLVIEAIPEDEDNMDDDMDMDDESSDMDDDMDMDDESSDMDDSESEEDDMSVPKLESKKDKYSKYAKKIESKKALKDNETSFEEAYKKWRAERKRRLEALKRNRKNEAESEIGVEYGSETGKIVGNGKTFDGGKTDIGKGNTNGENDADGFGIESTSTSDMVGSGKAFSGGRVKVSPSGTRTSEKKSTQRKRLVNEEEAVTDEFEDNDDLEGALGGDLDYADIPLDVGADADSIEKYEAVQKRRKQRNMNESTMNESFDFKKLVRGEYK